MLRIRTVLAVLPWSRRRLANVGARRQLFRAARRRCGRMALRRRGEPGSARRCLCLGARGAPATASGEADAYGASAKSGDPSSRSDASADPQPRGVAAVGVTKPPRGADFYGAARTAAEAGCGGALARVWESGDPAANAWRHQPAETGPVIRHPVAWGAWTIAALAAAFIDRNPYVQALLLLAVINVYLPYRGRRQATWKFGLALAIVPILFSAALSRFGRHVLFTLPPIPIIGGRRTLDAVAFGASTGLALLLTVAVFAVLQSTVRSADVLAILPRPLYRAGTTVALALAFAPKTLAAFQSIREARQLRGQRTGWRAAPALLLPLLLTTLERALQYGESLDARGFGSGRRSRYRPFHWTAADLLVVIASLAAIVVIALLPVVAYNPYVDLVPAAPNPDRLLAVGLLAVPAVIAGLLTVDHARHHA